MFNLEIMDKETPGGVYLCQVSENISCGACCGLYNVSDGSYEAMAEMLQNRTNRFRSVERSVDAILAFKEETEAGESQERPYPDFHHCPYIGLIDNNSRVGCLLHPLAEGNDGVDFRGLSYYGGMACRSYFCLSCKELPGRFKRILRESAEDWYTYGLIITEKEMVNAFFAEVESLIGRNLSPNDIVENAEAVQAVQEFIRLKLNWPFQTAPLKPGNYFFEDRQYRRPPIPYESLGMPKSPYDRLLKELESVFSSTDEVTRAEKMLSALLERLADAFRRHNSKPKSPEAAW